jgi:hypothetical protein
MSVHSPGAVLSDLWLAWVFLHSWRHPGGGATLPFLSLFLILVVEGILLGIEPFWQALLLARPDGRRVLPSWAALAVMGVLTGVLGTYGLVLGHTFWPVFTLWLQFYRVFSASGKASSMPPLFWGIRWLLYLLVMVGSLAVPASTLPPAPSPDLTVPLQGFWVDHPVSMYVAGVTYFTLTGGLRLLWSTGLFPRARS